MAYNLTKSNGTTSVTVADNTVGSTPALSVALLGKNYQGYGKVMAETILHMLENFAATTAPVDATPGQLWFDLSTGTMNFRANDNSWRKLLGESGSSNILTIYNDLLPDITCSSGTGIDLGSPTKKFCNVYADVFNGVATSARYADLAERYEADQLYEVGTLVKIGGEKEVTQTTEAFDSDVFGIISTEPGMRLNADAGDDTTHPYIALSGRVPTKLIGPAKKGQRIVASDIPGVARAITNLDQISPFSVIGRALTEKTDDSLGNVLVSIGAK